MRYDPRPARFDVFEGQRCYDRRDGSAVRVLAVREGYVMFRHHRSHAEVLDYAVFCAYHFPEVDNDPDSA